MNWLKQANEPLFPDLMWSRPQNRRSAGRLLVIGGHKQSFNDVSQAYAGALKAGAGTVRVILPDSLQKMLVRLFPEAEYAPSTPIGSFSRGALAEMLDTAGWAETVMLAGDFGRNSETAVLLESFVDKYDGRLALAGDSIDYFFGQPAKLTGRENTLVIGSLAQVQKLAAPSLIQQNADFIKAVEQVSNWVQGTGLAVVTEHSSQVIAAYQEQISTTPVKRKPDNVILAAYAIVWWLQHPEKPFEALTTAAYCLNQE